MKAHLIQQGCQLPGTCLQGRWQGLVLVTLFLLSSAVTPSAAQDIYKWEDARGILHYSFTRGTPQAKRLQRDTLLSFSREEPVDTAAAEAPAEREAALAIPALSTYSELATEALPRYNELLVENDRLLRLMASVVTTSPEVGWAPQPLPLLVWPQVWLEGSRQFWFTGGIYNLGQGSCENPAIEAEVFDERGSWVGSFETGADADILEWEEAARFEGQGVTPVGGFLWWEAVPRCESAAGVIYGARQRGSLALAGGSRIWWGDRFRTQ
jgi:hypothetical protein